MGTKRPSPGRVSEMKTTLPVVVRPLLQTKTALPGVIQSLISELGDVCAIANIDGAQEDAEDNRCWIIWTS